MAGVARPRLTFAERAEIWRRFKEGEAPSAIARALARSPQGVLTMIARHGGIAPAPRRRAPRTLQMAEREAISRGLAAGCSLRVLARQLGRAPSTISREVRRHGGATRYRATDADHRAWRRSRRPKACRLATHPALRRLVARKLAQAWSPQQISGWLKATYPSDPERHVSHETIYVSLFIQARGVLKQALQTQLRRSRGVRRARRATGRERRGVLLDAVSIRERPPTVEDRAVPGHWEGDLLAGTRQSHIVTLVERASRYVLLARLPQGRETTQVVRALQRQVRRLPRGLMQTLTWDRGKEMTAHRTFTVATAVQVYFCDPYSPWQRGSNENTNGLLRQYLPKGYDLSGVTQRELDRIARELNTRPRLTLGFKTPAETLAAAVASTA
jgi:IS30 family transposase